MKKIWFLKALGMVLFLFTALFFTANQILAATTDTYIEFDNIDESAQNAQYIRWEAKAKLAYDVVVTMIDDDGNKFTVTFSTKDDSNPYTVSSSSYVNNIGTSYYNTNPSIQTFEASFNTLMSNFFILGGTHFYTPGNSRAKIDKIRIYGDDIYLYYFGLANGLGSPVWEIDDSDFSSWSDVSDFKSDDGDLSDTATIDFQDTYLRLTKKVASVTTGTTYQIDPATGLPYGYGTSGYPTTGYYPYGYYPTTGYPTTYPTTGYPTTGYPTTTGYATYVDPRTGQQYLVPTTGSTTTGYPTTTGYYPTTTGTGYYPTTGTGYYPTTGTGYYPTMGTGYYPTTSTGTGYYPTTGTGYYPTTGTGYYPTTGTGYYPTTGTGYYPTTGTGAGYYPATGGVSPGYGQQYAAAGAGYGQQYLGGYGYGTGRGMNLGLQTAGLLSPTMYPPLGLTIPPAGMNTGLGFDPFGFGLGLTGLGAFDPLSIAALANGYPGLGLMGLGGLGLF
ncbi:MAG: hypothetical protein AB1847_05515 [bacterium]